MCETQCGSCQDRDEDDEWLFSCQFGKKIRVCKESTLLHQQCNKWASNQTTDWLRNHKMHTQVGVWWTRVRQCAPFFVIYYWQHAGRLSCVSKLVHFPLSYDLLCTVPTNYLATGPVVYYCSNLMANNEGLWQYSLLCIQISDHIGGVRCQLVKFSKFETFAS